MNSREGFAVNKGQNKWRGEQRAMMNKIDIKVVKNRKTARRGEVIILVKKW